MDGIALLPARSEAAKWVGATADHGDVASEVGVHAAIECRAVWGLTGSSERLHEVGILLRLSIGSCSQALAR
jgi:hypothetical protein